MKYLNFIFPLLFSISALAQLPVKQRLDSLFTNMEADQEFNGVVFVTKNDSTILKMAYGMSDFENNVPLTTSSVFDLASLTKQFTAMGIVLLQKEDKIDYDNKVAEILPELSIYPKITILQLLNHTSGLPDYMEFMENGWDKSNYATNDDVIKLMKSQKLEPEFEPGEEFSYSNTGYLVLASIIEKVSGMSYGDYLATKIFRPLGMNQTLVNRPRFAPKEIDNLTKGYITNNANGRVMPVEEMGMDYFQIYLDGIVGDGMVNSTVDDLNLWIESLTTDQLINDEDRSLIFKNYKTRKGEDTNYGYGFSIKTDSLYGKVISHAGGWAGYANYFERHLDKDLTFIMLQNTSLYNTRIPVAQVRKILYKQPIKQLIPKIYSSEELMKYSGTYKLEEEFEIVLFEKDGQFYGQGTGQAAFQLETYADEIFKFKPADITITFNNDVTELYLKQGKSTTTFRR